MGLLSQIIGGPLLDGLKGIISEFKLDPAKKAELDSHLADLQAAAEAGDRQLEQSQLDLQAKLNDIAGQNIRTDSSSNDSFVRRARPFFLWVMATAIGVNLLLFPMVNLAFGKGLTPITIPADYISLYKVAFLGYCSWRSVEKLTGKD